MARRSALISAASLAGVALAGVASIGASLGLLRSSDRAPVGDLSAEMASTRDVQGVDEVVPEAAPIGGSSATSVPQQVDNDDEDPIEHDAIEYEGGDDDD
jgi:hypothetical protein